MARAGERGPSWTQVSEEESEDVLGSQIAPSDVLRRLQCRCDVIADISGGGARGFRRDSDATRRGAVDASVPVSSMSVAMSPAMTLIPFALDVTSPRPLAYIP